eukprot:1159778-Pelagomonas_calceolata.AAC.7
MGKQLLMQIQSKAIDFAEGLYFGHRGQRKHLMCSLNQIIFFLSTSASANTDGHTDFPQRHIGTLGPNASCTPKISQNLPEAQGHFERTVQSQKLPFCKCLADPPASGLLSPFRKCLADYRFVQPLVQILSCLSGVLTYGLFTFAVFDMKPCSLSRCAGLADRTKRTPNAGRTTHLHHHCSALCAGPELRPCSLLRCAGLAQSPQHQQFAGWPESGARSHAAHAQAGGAATQQARSGQQPADNKNIFNQPGTALTELMRKGMQTLLQRHTKLTREGHTKLYREDHAKRRRGDQTKLTREERTKLRREHQTKLTQKGHKKLTREDQTRMALHAGTR